MKTKGFTLVELLVVLLIASVLYLVSANAVRNFFKRLEASRVTAELYHLCIFARSEAAHTRQTITVCGSSNGYRCDAQWAEGALLFQDSNRNGRLDTAEQILRYSPMKITPSHLEWKGFSGDHFTVEAFGIPFASNGHFTYCDPDQEPEYSRQVIINRGGRVRISRDKNGDGRHEDINGGLIMCPD